VTDANRAHLANRRGDIQGLRALAVVLVVVYHFFPSYIPGGFVGVDVFFVISGFLITLLLLREIEATGRISLSRFYSRRIRRLMPASLTVTVVTLLAAVLLLGPLQIADAFTDAAWSTAYVANIHLAQSTDGYFAVDDPSLFRHFWSLAVEEQYYLVWPILLSGIVLVARKRVRAIAPVVLGVLLIGSLISSVILTGLGSPEAYYSLGTRAWELAIGGLIAFTVLRASRPPTATVASIAALLGVAAVVGSALKFTDLTPFPSWTAAIPTIGAGLIVWAGAHRAGDVSRVLSIRPVTFVGDISYSLYLWHWPVLVLGIPFVGAENIAKVPLVMLSVILSIATYHLVERKAANFRLSIKPIRLVVFGLTATAVTVVLFAATSLAFPSTGGPPVAEATPVNAEADVVGSEIRLSNVTTGLLPAGLPENVSPTLRDLTDDLAAVFSNGCAGLGLQVCEGGDSAGAKTVAMIGDSQMGQWWPAVDAAAKANGWKLFIVIKNACPAAVVSISDPTTGSPRPDCESWQQAALDTVNALDADVVLYANHSLAYHSEALDRSAFDDAWVDAIQGALRTLTSSSRVVFFGQFPRMQTTPEQCLIENLRAVANCSTPLDVAVPEEIRRLDVEMAGSGGALYFDPTQLLCDDRCAMVSDNRIIYRDSDHLTGSYSRILSPAIAEAIRAALTNEGVGP
jgi:peptidoglycan/LPS O-acetylase OafA/YrhL